ncbi:hypothetical protein RYD26_12110 [Pasteurellaceae bacterium LIM206]|nr:hypothetical protein [Pasteurellaceae bacterium LIM206]
MTRVIMSKITKGVWAMGSGKLSGEFIGTKKDNGDGTFYVKGKIKYYYSDRFEDHYDTFNMIDGSWDLFGVPYDIEETWEVDI